MQDHEASPPNPYAAPLARVEDLDAQATDGAFIVDGRRVPASHGARWIGEGFSLYKQHPALWMGIGLAFLLITLVVQIIPFLGWLAGTVLGPIWIAGLMIGCRAVARGENLRFSHLFAGFAANPAQLMMFGAVNLLCVIAISAVSLGAGFGMMGGSMAAGMPPSLGGFLMIALVSLALATPYFMAVWFGPPLIALSAQSVGASLRGSFLACAKNWLPFLVYSLIFAGIGIAIVAVIGAAGGFAMFGMMARGAGGFAAGGTMAGAGLGMLTMLVIVALVLPLFFASVYASFQDIFYQPPR